MPNDNEVVYKEMQKLRKEIAYTCNIINVLVEIVMSYEEESEDDFELNRLYDSGTLDN